MSNARGNWRGKRLLNTRWRKQPSPPEAKEGADPERKRNQPQGQTPEEAMTAEVRITTSAPDANRIVYINGIYAPVLSAGPSSSTGAIRKERSTLNREAPMPDVAPRDDAVDSPADTKPVPLMALAATRPEEVPLTDEKRSNPEPVPYRAMALAPRRVSDFPLFPFKYKTTGTR